MFAEKSPEACKFNVEITSFMLFMRLPFSTQSFIKLRISSRQKNKTERLEWEGMEEE